MNSALLEKFEVLLKEIDPLVSLNETQGSIGLLIKDRPDNRRLLFPKKNSNPLEVRVMLSDEQRRNEWANRLGSLRLEVFVKESDMKTRPHEESYKVRFPLTESEFEANRILLKELISESLNKM
jgi:hypothetical protein